MKHIYRTIAIAACTCAIPALYAHDNDSVPASEKTLFEEVTGIKKKTDKFNLYLNMHGDFNAQWNGKHFDEGKFEMKQLRIEMKGQINDWLSYRYRQRLNTGDSPAGYRDNVLKSIDYAGIGVTLKKFYLFLGKQCAAYGGIDFDRNPIEIYQYPEMIQTWNNFLTGVNVAYNFTDKQQLQFQMLNSLTGTTQEMYGNYERAKMPMVYTINWNGNFNDVFKTRWSASFMNETKGEHLYFFALGNEFKLTEKFGGYLDWMYSREGVDRHGIITTMIKGDTHERNVTKADYMAVVLRLNYRLLPSWNLVAKATLDTAGIYEAHGGLSKGNYCTTWGYVGGIEYYPFKDRNLHFFAVYTGRTHNYTSRAKAFGNTDYSTNNLSVGFIWQMPVF